jgi:hypothetical protein
VEVKHKNINHNAFLYWGVIKHGVPQGSFIFCFLSTQVIDQKLFMENINKRYLQISDILKML